MFSIRFIIIIIFNYFLELLVVPAGFDRGLEFKSDGFTVIHDGSMEINGKSTSHFINLADIAQNEEKNLQGTLCIILYIT